MLKRLLKELAHRTPGIGRLLSQRDQLAAALEHSQGQMQFEPGHFYSPVASCEDIAQRYSELQGKPPTQIPGVTLHLEQQFLWCKRIAAHYAEHPFPEQQTQGIRYYSENSTFTYSDAVFLYGMLRELMPKRIVEIGSGFSSAVMLDTNERFLKRGAQMTFIEPYPDRLHELLSIEDRKNCRIIDQRVQDVVDRPWSALESGDILFIDSSHVSKCGSDVNQIFFDVLPSLAKGVVVHIHDVFLHFEYPEDWLRQRRSWNEDYLLRAFLQFNDSFQILLWVPLMIESHQSFVEEHMPGCLRNSGGSFWMRRTA